NEQPSRIRSLHRWGGSSPRNGSQTPKIENGLSTSGDQIKGEAQAKEPFIQKYLSMLKDKLAKLETFEAAHVPRDQNTRADVLARLASTRPSGVTHSFIQETLERPSIAGKTMVNVASATPRSKTWMDLVVDFITKGELPEDPSKATLVKRRASNHTVIEGLLYKRGISIPLLKCLAGQDALAVLQEVHDGIARQHMGGRALTKKVLRAGYYCPSMVQDANDFVRKCEKCQIHGDMHNGPPTEMSSITTSWPFMRWGMDLLGPLKTTPGQLKYLIVAVDYCTKWVEAEALAKITAANVIKF
ncbi:hypothetical protein A2U01_0019643, partial [Trifolium medium]|nr:hypothetical protein [Trifolium medium]